MTFSKDFLNGSQILPWTVPNSISGAKSEVVYLGKDDAGLGAIQIAIATASIPPSKETMRALYSARKGKSNIQLVVGTIVGQSIWIFGPDERTQVAGPLPLDQGLRQLQSALDEPNSLAAYTRLGQFRRSLDTTSLVGVTNSGLFASYHIRENVPKRSDWAEACEISKTWLDLRNTQLISALGFKTQKTAGNALLLTSKTPQPRAVAILLDESEQFDSTSARHTGISPVAFGLNIAIKQGVPWLLVLRKDQIRIYPARDGVGVGQKGQVETYLEIDLAAIDSDRAGLLKLIFSAEALEPEGTAQELLTASQRFASELGTRLRERIYIHVVPQLAKSVAEQLRSLGTQLDASGLELSYRLTLRILFRLLFQAYAEDRGLLPAGRNAGYDANSLKSIAQRIINQPAQNFGNAKTLWLDLVQVWNAIDEGNELWNVPAYNGGLFGTDAELHPEGALIEKIEIHDRELGPVLQHLLIDISEDQVPGPVDFRSLSVREFGTIYEGLLESSLSVAPTDLTIDSDDVWVPAKPDELVFAKQGEIYFHSASGERRSTGSYFTKSTLVDHLIERALEPALDEHLSGIQTLINENKEAEASGKFFDFRVMDLAMGSGHFLVAAIDRIESRMRTFLSEKESSIPGVTAQLHRLQTAAISALGSDAIAFGEIEPAALLRRQIARRCVYGIDINDLAVELSRLAIWIHTFVPGLPMSNLNHNLVCANSLTGVSGIDQAISIITQSESEGQFSLFGAALEENLSKVSKLLLEVANSDEADKREVKISERRTAEALVQARPAKAILDASVAIHLGLIDSRTIFSDDDLLQAVDRTEISESLKSLNPAQMPYLFPEVFLREKPGFDVILGNPPWKDIVFDEPRYWSKFAPGLMALSIQDRKKAIADLRDRHPELIVELERQKKAFEDLRKVLHAFFPLGSGNTDLYKAFCFKFWSVIRDGGRIGMVLPKTAFSAAGLADWRKSVLSSGSIIDLVTIVNSGKWAFDIEPRYTVALVVLGKDIETDISIAGAFHSEPEFKAGRESHVKIPKQQLLNYTSNASIPIVSQQLDVDILTQMRKSPMLSDWNGGILKLANEFHASNEREYFDHTKSAKSLEVFAGDSFNIWNLRTGNIFAYADPKIAKGRIAEKFVNQNKLSSSVFYKLDLKTDLNGLYPFERARIAYRSVSRTTDSRTIIASVVPPNTILTHISPYIFTLPGHARDEAFVLGVLSSIPFDFYARKFIETAVDIHFMKAFPIPESSNKSLTDHLVKNVLSLIPDEDALKTWRLEASEKKAVNYTPEDNEKLICENDAIVAHLYGLKKSHVQHIFRNFQRGWDNSERLEKTLKYFDYWKGKLND